MTTKKETTLNAIATQILQLKTLETRKSDSLDFREQAVWSLKRALEMAYEAGRKSAGGKMSEEATRFFAFAATN
ncbi:MAG: hypothetical protein K8T20_17885 [Planctomycetes bacterium]|nr:hypothetical protein [Planctomycetota bacterium]